MKIYRSSHRSASRRGGFTIVDTLVATAVSMILLYGAIYSTLESVAVASAGDTRINTQIHARRVLERLVKDCRYASEIEVTGSQANGWTIDLTTGLNDDDWTWTWDPVSEALTVSDGSGSEIVVSGLVDFSVDTQNNSQSEIERITMVWTVQEVAGATGTTTADTTATFPGSTWVRAHME